jgi:hypothetical protein
MEGPDSNAPEGLRATRHSMRGDISMTYSVEHRSHGGVLDFSEVNDVDRKGVLGCSLSNNMWRTLAVLESWRTVSDVL